MKTIGYFLPALFCLFLLSRLSAQNKWVGLSQYGNYDDGHSGGMLWEVNADGTNFNVLKHWAYPRIGSPADNLVLAQDGKLYGLTQGLNGDHRALFLIQYDPLEGQITHKKIIESGVLNTMFGNADMVRAPMFMGADGYLYGCHRLFSGGVQIFRIKTDGSGLDNIFFIEQYYDELAGLGQMPDGRMVAATGSNTLKIMAGWPDGSDWKVIFEFSEAPGTYLSRIVAGTDGYIYGCLKLPSGNVRFFKLLSDGSGYSVIAETALGWIRDFIRSDDGQLYGMAVGSYTIHLFQVNPLDNNFAVIHTFDENAVGYLADNSLTILTDGTLCFSTNKPEQSCIYKIAPGNQVPQAFCTASTSYGYTIGKLVIAPDGKMYGWKLRPLNENVDGLSGISGAIFSMQPDGTDFQYLYVMDEPPAAGAVPTLLIRGNDENYYGAVTLGGQHNSGYIFKMSSDGADFTPLFQLPANTRMLSLLHTSNGQLTGGFKNTQVYNETIFSVSPDGSNYKVLNSNAQAQSICEGEDGKIYWLNGFRLLRMNLDGSWKTDLGPLYTGDDYHAYGGQLRRLPNGQLWGWINYYYYIGCLDEGYGRLYFTLNNDGSLSNLADQQYAYGEPVADGGNYIYSQNRKINIANFNQSNLPEMDDCIRHLSAAGTDGWIYGRDDIVYYYWEEVDLNAFNPDDGACLTVVPAHQAGHLARFCLEVSAPTSTESTVEDERFNLSPNPVQTTMQVSLKAPLVSELEWQIYSMTGYRMSGGRSNLPLFDIPVEYLPDGAYYLTISQKDGQRISKLFVKVK